MNASTNGQASDAADLWRDAWGIPHIKTRTRDEAFAALGFAHARDRLWQMEALLRRATGRYAEWLGAPAVNGDILARQVDAAGASQRDFASLTAETRAMLESYARGVNAFIATGYRPIEYRLLGAEPAAWVPWHSIAVMRQIGFLMGSFWWKLWRAAALPIVGHEAIAKLRFEDSGSEFLCLPPGLEKGPYRAALDDLRAGAAALLEVTAPDVSGGSNNWALSPKRTATGRPLVAGDPHRVLEMPGMYAQAHIACDEFDVIGLTVPGVPGFPHFGHNGHVAWCVTHAFVDIHDLYVERFSEDGKSSLFKGQWEPVQLRREEIAVRGGAPVALEVAATRHGSVLVGGPDKGWGLALRSMQFNELDRSFDALLPMMRAHTVETLYEATREWGLIDHNLVTGDVTGKIGYRVRAKVPRRPSSNGWLPVPGWNGEHEWDGIIEWSRMPAQIDPPEGAIVTANNRVAENGEDYLCTDAMPPHRARRVWRRLEALTAATVEDMASIHRDIETTPGAEMREQLRAAPEPKHPEAAALRRLILEWDGQMAPGSRGATAYNAVRLALTRLVATRSGLAAAAHGPFGGVAPGLVPQNQLWWTVPGLLRNDDRALLKGATWGEMLTEALIQAAASPVEEWGAAHLPRLTHPLSASFPAQAAALDRVSAPIGGDNDTLFMTGCSASVGQRAISGSLSRYVFDVGAWENCRWIVFHGASGEPGDPWHMSQNETWAAGEMVPMLYDWSAIEAGAATRQRLFFRGGDVYGSEPEGAQKGRGLMLEGLKLGDRENFTTRVYKQLREALMAGRFWPSQRLRIGELAVAMGVSQTPVREAIMQLVREGGLDIRSSQSITVTNLSVSRYKELREVRLLLEGLATEKATPLITSAELARLEQLHAELIAAEKSGDSEKATLANFHFHFLIYRASQMSDLVAILEGVWLRNGPLLKYLYPYAPPTYPGQHQHVTLMEALRRRDPAAARQAVQDDMIEGGARLVELMGKIESGEAAVVEGPDGAPQLTFRGAPKRKVAAKESQA